MHESRFDDSLDAKLPRAPWRPGPGQPSVYMLDFPQIMSRGECLSCQLRVGHLYTLASVLTPANPVLQEGTRICAYKCLLSLGVVVLIILPAPSPWFMCSAATLLVSLF